MDTVTYPDPKVRDELLQWTFAQVDISEYRDVAELFGVSAIPVAIVATSEGKLVERVIGFVEPGPFSQQLRHIREKN